MRNKLTLLLGETMAKKQHTYLDAAVVLHVHERSVINWVRGHHLPYPKHHVDIAKYCGITLKEARELVSQSTGILVRELLMSALDNEALADSLTKKIGEIYKSS